MLHVEPEPKDAVLAERQTRTFEIRGRAMESWLRVDVEGVETLSQLVLVELGVAHARSLPPK